MKEPETGKKENTGKSGYSITTWRLHLWCRHPEWLRTTQEFYNRIAEFYYNLLLDHTDLWELGSQQTLRELEIMSIPGRGGRIPSDPLPWQKVPLYFRRAAANEGIASAKSYISRFAQDEKIGRAEKLNAAVTYYKGMYQDFSAKEITLRVWTGDTWTWMHCRLSGRDFPENARLMSPSVVFEYKYQKDTFKLVKVNDISEYKISKVVVGSDQVWNLELTGGDLNYFLPFVEPECRISYAASVGHVGDNIDKKIFEEKLSLFDSISVREKELADMINSLNINKKAVICMDPVFLKSKLAWKEYIADTDININFPYILVFIMGVSKQADYIVRRALEVGKKNNCQVILIGDQERWYKYRQVKHFGVATPREFIKLIDSAKCVFTNSFHATAFSIILNSSFYTEMNISNNGRIESLLNLAGLESRKMYDGKLNSLYTTKINWDIVTKKLQPEIEKSKKFLQVNFISNFRLSA